jgi:hypothetical protein
MNALEKLPHRAEGQHTNPRHTTGSHVVDLPDFSAGDQP